MSWRDIVSRLQKLTQGSFLTLTTKRFQTYTCIIERLKLLYVRLIPICIKSFFPQNILTIYVYSMEGENQTKEILAESHMFELFVIMHIFAVLAAF